jgi:negative regulator of flagellin synthesis FlgM
MVSDIKGIGPRQATGPRQGETGVVRNDGRSSAAARNGGAAEDDTVELSGLAEVISTAAKKLAAAESPVNEARVQELRDAIASGSYDVDPARIARKLIDADNL